MKNLDGGKRGELSLMELYDWVQCFISAIVAGILIFMFLFRVITVDGSSMNPTLVSWRQDNYVPVFSYTPNIRRCGCA